MRRAAIILGLILMIFAAGCGEQGQTGGKTDPFIGGVGGIDIQFAEGSPPGEVYDGGSYPFEISLILQNNGEHDVSANDVNVKISGINAAAFGVSEGDLKKSPEEDLLATQKDSEGDIIEGPEIYMTFDGLNHEEQLEGNNQFPIRADVCYKYETRAVADVCVRENNIDTTKEGVCTVSGIKTVYNSAAPLQVTNFKESPMARNKVRLSFTVSHVGNGEIFKEGTQCSKDTTTDEDRVWVEVTSGISGALKCSGLEGGSDTSGYTRLFGGDKVIICSLEVDTESDYSAPVNVKLVYDYEEDISSTILVKHAAS